MKNFQNLQDGDEMTEFTAEWIAQTREQLKLVSPLPWKACSCSKCGMITGEKDLIAVATRGNWGDDYPVIKPVGGSIGGQYEVVMEQITYGHIPPETGNANAQYIAEACTNYPKALDHIERQRERIAELEAVQAVIMYLHGENERLRATLGLIKSRGMAHGVEWCVTVACTLDREGE